MFGLENEVLTYQVKDVKSTITAVIDSCNQGRTQDFFTRGQQGLYAEKSPKYPKNN
jgi:zona occludens toxin (predicted ATPase)